MPDLRKDNADRITVRVLKYDGSEYRKWQATLAERRGPLLLLTAEFEDEVSHDLMGTIHRGTKTIEYYWLDRWYSVFRFLDSEGQTTLYYCNINMPPEFSDDELRYIDLDIDILVRPNLTYQLLDLDDFESNARLMSYSHEMIERAKAATDELIGMIGRMDFPFRES